MLQHSGFQVFFGQYVMTKFKQTMMTEETRETYINISVFKGGKLCETIDFSSDERGEV